MRKAGMAVGTISLEYSETTTQLCTTQASQAEKDELWFLQLPLRKVSIEIMMCAAHPPTIPE